MLIVLSLQSRWYHFPNALQGKCKANAEPSSLELCWAAAFTRTRNFLLASTKVRRKNDACKFRREKGTQKSTLLFLGNLKLGKYVNYVRNIRNFCKISKNPHKMGVSGDIKSIVSRRLIRLRESTLPLTTDSCSGGGGFWDTYLLHRNVKYILKYRINTGSVVQWFN